jgi:hypothetical protein
VVLHTLPEFGGIFVSELVVTKFFFFIMHGSAEVATQRYKNYKTTAGVQKITTDYVK